MGSKHWQKETDLCADFIEWAKRHDWSVYPECGGWDILLVRPGDGFQIGIQAKLSLNAKVLCQVIEADTGYRAFQPGPDVHAVLVPMNDCVNGLAFVAKSLGIVVIQGLMRSRYRYIGGKHEECDVADFQPSLPKRSDWDHSWPERCPDERIKLPDYVPDCIAGDKSPVMLTEWKIKAIKVMIVIEKLGCITRADMKALGIDPSRWTQYWLRSNGDGGWTPKDNSSRPDFKSQHPVNYEQIAADFEKWSKVLPARITEAA